MVDQPVKNIAYP